MFVIAVVIVVVCFGCGAVFVIAVVVVCFGCGTVFVIAVVSVNVSFGCGSVDGCHHGGSSKEDP